MLRAFNLLFFPGKEWEKIAVEPPHPLPVILLTLFPMMILGLGIEAYGLLNFESVSEFGRIRVPEERVIKYVLFYAAAGLAVIIAGAKLLQSVGQSFNLTAGYGICFALMGVGYSPIFLLRILDAVPQINTWICWGIGAALSFRILYHGVALWLKPEQTKGFGLFLVSLVYTVVLSALVHFASIQVLNGHFLKNLHIPGKSRTMEAPSGTNEKSGHLSQMPAQPKQPN